MATDHDDVRVRRVGFRNGTNAELAAQHLVESEIEVERHPGTVPQPLDLYTSWARNLPSQFEDHTWIAETDDGTPVGCAACWANTAGDPTTMESYVYVRTAWRRRGVGARLARAVLDTAIEEGRRTLVWSTYDAIPAGEPFARRVGGRIGRVNRTSVLRIERLDREQLQTWIDDGPRRALGFRLDFWDGPYPAHLAEDAARFHHLMNTQPRDDLQTGDVFLDPGHVAELDRALVEAGRERWTVFVRDPADRCVGGTEITLAPWEPAVVYQQNTAIHPDHRGRGLAKWAKAAVLARLCEERPVVTHVRTGNAFSNAPMLAINDALGFEVVEVRTEWHGAVDELRVISHE